MYVQPFGYIGSLDIHTPTKRCQLQNRFYNQNFVCKIKIGKNTINSLYYDYLNVEEGVRNLFHPPSLRGEILLKLLSIETVVFPTQAHLSSPHHHPPGRFIRFLIQDSSTSPCRKPKSSFKVVPSSELLENQWNSQEYKINVQLKEGDVLGFIYDHVELNTSQFLHW